MGESVFDQVQQIAADLFNVPIEQVTAQSTPEDLENWDSLQQLNLVLALEESFQLELAPEEIERISSIGSAVRIVEEKLGVTTEAVIEKQ
jgi:acyl carrier protein